MPWHRDGMDSSRSSHNARGEGQNIWKGHVLRTSGSASGNFSCLRLFSFERGRFVSDEVYGVTGGQTPY